MQGNPPGVEPDLVTLERNSFNFLEYSSGWLVFAVLLIMLSGT